MEFHFISTPPLNVIEARASAANSKNSIYVLQLSHLTSLAAAVVVATNNLTSINSFNVHFH
jgi:hypothetical protein